MDRFINTFNTKINFTKKNVQGVRSIDGKMNWDVGQILELIGKIVSIMVELYYLRKFIKKVDEKE